MNILEENTKTFRDVQVSKSIETNFNLNIGI